ncbi:MAG: RidA family protein [Cyanobacteria bacterium P01_H01_bin.74]
MSRLKTPYYDVETIDALMQILPAPPTNIGNYYPLVQVDNMIYSSGFLPVENNIVKYTGSLGSWGTTVEKGQEASELCILNCLSSICRHLSGDWQCIERVVKLTGYVNSLNSFFHQPEVLNGASDFLIRILGEKGRHARSAVGVASLPCNASVEIDLVVKLK